MGFITKTFNAAARSDVRYTPPTPEACIERARTLFDKLGRDRMSSNDAKELVEEIKSSLKSANFFANIQKPSTGYDVWVLDRTWDTDPLNCKSSNAVMEAELARRVKDAPTRVPCFYFNSPQPC